MVLSPAPLGPIDAVEALARVEEGLSEVLGSLSAAEWDLPTVVARWRVRDVVAHLLDTSHRKLSIVRDGYFAEGPASGAPADVRTFVDRINAEGVTVYGRLSHEVLLGLVRNASRQFCDLHRGLDPQALAVFAVSWAGEQQSSNWFDTARELTERWHHQEQIRMAVNRPGIMTRDLYHPVLDCFMRALPYAYRSMPAPTGSHIDVKVTGSCGGLWQLYREADRWTLTRGVPGEPLASIAIPESLAWRIFTKGIGPGEAEGLVRLEGDLVLGAHVLKTVAIVG